MSTATRHGRDSASWAHYYSGDVTWRLLASNAAGHLALIRRVLWPRPKRALEVGTGTATMAAMVSYFGVNVTSVDLERPVLARGIETLGKFHGRARLVQADAFKLPFADGSFDIAFSQGFFEHFQDGEIAALLCEQARVARRVAFSVPNALYGIQDYGNERLLTRFQWDALIRETGLRLLNSGDYAPVRKRFWGQPPIHYLAIVSAK